MNFLKQDLRVVYTTGRISTCVKRRNVTFVNYTCNIFHYVLHNAHVTFVYDINSGNIYDPNSRYRRVDINPYSLEHVVFK